MLKIKAQDDLYHVFKVLHEGLQIIPGGILNKSNEKATQKDLRSLGLSEYKLDTGTSGATLGRAFSGMCYVGVCIYLCVFVQQCMMQWRKKSL